MALEERRQAIESLEEARGSTVLVHFLSDRRSPQKIPGLNTVFAGEPQLLVFDHLRALEPIKQLDLVLYTTGGSTDSVWPFVTLCREMSDTFNVLIPLKALSAGTLLALGADEIVLSRAAQLSPADPSTGNQFNPRDPSGNSLAISVEDLTEFFALARDRDKGIGLGDDNILEIFKILADQVHPLALGNVNRVHRHIRDLAENLIKTRGGPAPSDLKNIVQYITEAVKSHTHIISRKEALKELGEELVSMPDDKTEEALWALFESYADFLKLRHTFNVKSYLGDEDEKELTVIGAILESRVLSHLFKTKSIVRKRPNIPQGIQVQLPPGQRIPTLPGFGYEVEIDPIDQGWYPNTED